ncbi:MAG: flagellar biosynthetic protein FliO [Oscillospiraceae bacterium]|nr:flagellar biosynthetic protein FliO [Oscillospiraceae bacterium]
MSWPELLSLLGIILVLLLVMGGCYAFTRWAGTGLGGSLGRGSGRMQVVERLPVGREQALLVVRLAGRYLLLGSSPAGVSLLAELTEEEGAQWAPAAEPIDRPSVDFRELLRKLREKK